MKIEDTTPASPQEPSDLGWEQGFMELPALLQAPLPLGCRELRPVMGLLCPSLARMPG